MKISLQSSEQISKFVPTTGEKSSWNSLLTYTDKLTAVIF